MAHLTARQGYGSLIERLNRFPQGAPPSRVLFEILALLFSEKEAELVARLPVRPFTTARAAKVWGVGLVEAERTLQALAGKALLVDLEMKGRTYYVLPPPMAGFFEFALMRVRGDIDQKLLSELYEQYISVEEDFIKALFVGGKTQFGRVLVQESVLTSSEALHVLDYERASAIIESATDIGIGLCYCRHKRHHQGKACSAELDICMTFNNAAASLIRHNVVRRVDRSECLELLHRAFEQNLAQFGENVQQGVSFICNCCGCCCEAMLAARRFGIMRPIHTSGFIAHVEESCTGCGRCLPTCPVGIMTLHTEEEQGRGAKKALIEDDLCLGCGVCARNCPRKSIVMHRRGEKIITPVNGTHRTVLMAIERGKLQHLLFDNRVLWSHRALAAVFGVILNLSPVKRALAGEQIGSRYLGAICEKYGI